jgi:hypothetical protein
MFSGSICGTKNRRFSLLSLACGSAEAFPEFFMCACARVIRERAGARVKSRIMLPCFRKGGFSPVNIARNVRKQFRTVLPLLPQGVTP